MVSSQGHIILKIEIILFPGSDKAAILDNVGKLERLIKKHMVLRRTQGRGREANHMAISGIRMTGR
jgi:hypothetical protein